MKLLLDTHLLLWAAAMPERLSAEARRWLEAPEHQLHYSVASLWEVVIKTGLGRDDFNVDAAQLRRGLQDNGYEELGIASTHVLAVRLLPPLHRDPFDRLLVAQANAEGYTLLTADARLADYPGPIRLV